jgi:hypothetical protein
MLTDGLEVRHYLRVVALLNARGASYDEGEAEGVDIADAVVGGEDALPEAEGVEQLELLAEEEGDPPEGVVEGVDA